MVLQEAALEHNLGAVAEYCSDHRIDIAFHGKTSLSPALTAAPGQGGRRGTVRMASRVGATMPEYCTAVGNAMMAYCPDEVVATVLAGELRPFTDRTITDPELLRAEFTAIRRHGCSVGDRENEPEVRCVAAPIFGSDDHVVAALSVSSLSSGMTAKRVSEVGAVDTEASLRISAELVSRGASAGLAELGLGRA
ncbi:IclR family transcriptional regulator C-terminal domain-containing protein [Arthrobacter sp. UYEF20]|uniref:IclR family transcriptional regulator domain-containing protein n=1 Tax=Arthrobacter sp. UYEF20 TaxID=1756363 RepID=UPI003396CBB4